MEHSIKTISLVKYWHGVGMSVDWLARRYELKVEQVREILGLQIKLELDKDVIK